MRRRSVALLTTAQQEQVQAAAEAEVFARMHPEEVTR